MNRALDIYSAVTEKELMDSELTYGLDVLRNQTNESTWSLVSGGDQDQLHSIFKKKNIIHLFDGGIFGSPDTKNEILNRELLKGNIKLPAVYLGDSPLDHERSEEQASDL